MSKKSREKQKTHFDKTTKTPTQKDKHTKNAQNAFVPSSFFVFPDDDDDEKESSIRAFAKRVVVASSKSTKF